MEMVLTGTTKTTNNVIPEDLPEESNCLVENIKRRRSSLRRSINSNCLHSSLRVAASNLRVAAPDLKKKGITELCFSHALQSVKRTTGDNQGDELYEAEELLKSKLKIMVDKISINKTDTVQKQETPIRRNINKMTEEKALWQAEFQLRRKAFIVTTMKGKDAKKGHVVVDGNQYSKLRPRDCKFIHDLPDFKELNNQLPNFTNIFRIGLVHLEKLSASVKEKLSNETQLDSLHNKFATQPLQLSFWV